MSVSPRYLVSFHPKRVQHHFTDVLIIGGGLAGLRAAIGVDPELSVLVISKEDFKQSNSNFAQGGIAGVIDANDCFEDHIEDTLKAGAGICDRATVERVVREAPIRIQELIEWGTQFDHQADSDQLALGLEGGHSAPRIVHALGDMTGKEVMRALIARAKSLSNCVTWPRTFTLDLLVHEGACRGALVFNNQYGKTFVWAKQTIMCTGGSGQIYRETTNPPVATGDGLAIAHRAGCELRDMEFMQFHPTVLYIAGSSRSLLTEALRGDGAHLVDHQGHRFMKDYDPRAELASRDVVSQAIATQMVKTRHPNVYLDLRHLDAEKLRARFPGIVAICAKFNLDLATDWIPVRPGAHYMVGGLTVDGEGRTTLSGLWAAGEIASSGLHGANRLASNSLLEGLVYGAHAGAGASMAAREMPNDYQALPLENRPVTDGGEPLDLTDIRNSLGSLMWRNVGICRDGVGLKDAARMVDYWCRYVLVHQFPDPAGWQLQNMLTTSRIMIAAAMAREETRGVHQRSDFPQIDDTHWKRHITFRDTEMPQVAI